MAGIALGGISRESCAVSAYAGDPLMNCTPLLNAAKPDLAKQLAGLPCLVVYVKRQCFVFMLRYKRQNGMTHE